MLRLDPAHPPLWRDATTLQFGLEAVAIVRAPEPWHDRLVHELQHGLPPAAVETVGTALGAAPGEATAFVSRISRALRTASAPAQQVVLQVADGVSPVVADAVAQALGAAGFQGSADPWAGLGDATTRDADPVVMLANHVVEPRRAALFLGRDIPHLPVVFGGASVQIGPFVRPGKTACLACVAAEQLDADPAWARLAAQLLGRPAPAMSPAVAWEAGLAAARMLSDAVRRPARQTTRSLRLRVATGARTTRTHRPHAACRCRSLGGSAMAPVREAPETTTAREYALPA
jgi:bacteriocin biosynthesis cyclodehydratase domain-containing protein